MKAITQEQFFAIAGVRMASFRAFVSRGEAVLAFGSADRLAGGTFLDSDAVCWHLLDELTPALTRKHAANFLRAFSDTWMKAVARAERDKEPVWLVVGELGEKANGPQRNSYRNISADFGTLPEFDRWDYRKVKVVPSRLTLVNVTAVLAAVRWNASALGVTLSSPMIPDDDDPAFAKACAELKEGRRALAAEPRRVAQ